LSIAPTEPRETKPHVALASEKSGANGADAQRPQPRQRRKSTSHLKDVPESLALREQIKSQAESLAESLDKSRPYSKYELEQHGRGLLAKMELPEKYLGFAMVLIGNFFWKQQFLAVPFERRMLLLPHCLKHAEGCPAEYDEFGLNCEQCGACSIADYKVRAEELGYKVLVAEGSPVVLKIIISGYIDGILGVACLNVLEKAIDKVLMAGVPSYAIPLHSGNCKSTTLDESWIWDVLEKYEPLPNRQTSSYVPLMRAAYELFSDRMEQLLPRVRTKSAAEAGSPLGKTEQISYDWLANGGKRFRPFITLAAYDALSGAPWLSSAGINGDGIQVPDGVGQVAMAIEAFHKASLVHDDIEDDDPFRYGKETLHNRYDLNTAINVGDHLIGLGYRLVSSARESLGNDVTSDILAQMAAAHVKLCDGQGAEMAWQTANESDVTPLEALKIYALKTSPAFEAALYAGLRMAGPLDDYQEMIPLFSRHLGVGFQILNDLHDWRGDDNNKLVAGRDVLSLRPTVLMALALDQADEARRAELQSLFDGDEPETIRIGRLRRLFSEWGIFAKAEALVEKSRARAEALADDVEPAELRQFLNFLIETVLPYEDPVDAEEAADLVPLPFTGVVTAEIESETL